MKIEFFHKGISWLVTLLTPVVLVLAGVRLLLTPTFLQVEYNLPGFPADQYGFTKEDRLYWSGIALEYLLNSQGIEFLSNLEFEDGSPVYNERELRHMVDVKIVVKNVLSIWYVILGLLILLGVWAWFGKWGDSFLRGVSRGGWLTGILLGTAILLVLLSFGVFFVGFHQVFFEQGTWTFLYSDTLIRLFPERFWRDTFLFIGIFAGGCGFLLGYFVRRKDL